MRKVNLLIIMLLALSLIGVMVGCGDATPTPTATPTVKPTATPTATPTIKPTATPTATPTVTPATTPTVTPTATPTPTPVEPIKIGLLEDVTGPYAAYGSVYAAAGKTVFQMINDAGGIKSLGGAKIQIVEGLGDSTVATSTNEVERLINSEKVVAITGPTSTGETLACIPLFERYKIPVVSKVSDPTLFTKGYRYLFGVLPSSAWIGSTEADFIDWLAKNHGVPTDSIAVCNLAPGFSMLADGLVTRLAELGYTNVVLREEFSYGVTDQTSLVMKLKATNPSLVWYAGAMQDVVAFHKACYTFDYYPWMVADMDTYTNPLIKENLPANIAEKILTRPNIFGVGYGTATEVLKDIPSVNAFHAAFDKLYPGSTMSRILLGQGGQKAMVLACALENAGSRNPEVIADALRKVVIDAPSQYLVMAEAYPHLEISLSGLVAGGTVLGDQWSDDLSEHLIIWPEEFANAEPRIQK